MSTWLIVLTSIGAPLILLAFGPPIAHSIWMRWHIWRFNRLDRLYRMVDRLPLDHSPESNRWVTLDEISTSRNRHAEIIQNYHWISWAKLLKIYASEFRTRLAAGRKV